MRRQYDINKKGCISQNRGDQVNDSNLLKRRLKKKILIIIWSNKYGYEKIQYKFFYQNTKW